MRTGRGISLLKGALLAGLAVRPAVADDSKEVVSDHFRVVFLAGLEGSGHHYFTAANEALHRDNPGLPRLDQDLRLTHLPYYLPAYMGDKSSNFAKAEETARNQMRNLAEASSSLPDPGSVSIETDSWAHPSLKGIHKVMRYLDLPRMARVAADEGVDFRVVYLKRPVWDIIIANTVHRSFHRSLGGRRMTLEQQFLEYTRILFTEIAVMHSFLVELPPGHVICHDWSKLGDHRHTSKIAEFIAPNDEIARLVNSALMKAVQRRPMDLEPMPFFGARDVVARLQQKLDAFETALCASD